MPKTSAGSGDEPWPLLRLVLAGLLRREYEVYKYNKSEIEGVTETRTSNVLRGMEKGRWSELAKIMHLLQTSSLRRQRVMRKRFEVIKSYVRAQCDKVREKRLSVEAAHELLTEILQWRSETLPASLPVQTSEDGLRSETADGWLAQARAVLEDPSFTALRVALVDFCERELRTGYAAGNPTGAVPRALWGYPVKDPRLGIRKFVVRDPMSPNDYPWTESWIPLGSEGRVTHVARLASVVGQILSNLESILAEHPLFEPPRRDEKGPIPRAFSGALLRVIKMLGVKRKKVEPASRSPETWTAKDVLEITAGLHSMAGAVGDKRAYIETHIAFELRQNPLAEVTHHIDALREEFAEDGSLDGLESLRDHLQGLHDAMRVIFDPGGAQARDKAVAEWLLGVFGNDSRCSVTDPWVQALLAAARAAAPHDGLLRALLDEPMRAQPKDPDAAFLNAPDSVRRALQGRRCPRKPSTLNEVQWAAKQAEWRRAAGELRRFYAWIGWELNHYEDVELPAYRQARLANRPGQVFEVRAGLSTLLSASAVQSESLLAVIAGGDDAQVVPLRKLLLQRGVEATLRAHVEKFVL